MARLVLPVAFAAAGSFIPGVGWQAGWLVGSVASSLIFRQGGGGGREGPRLSDQLVSSSAEGAPIAIGFGTLRLAGNMIWAQPIKERKQTSRGGGKGGVGGGGGGFTEYSYSGSFAIGFAEGRARRLLRVWADGKLVFDRTGDSPNTKIEGLELRFYPGSETQQPDPLIAAEEGAARTPAFRGLCYLVFEDMELAEFGNRLPQITAEIAFRDVADQPADNLDLITTGEGGAFAGFEATELAVDWTRERGWLVEHATAQNSGLRLFDLRTMREIRQSTYEETLPSLAPSFSENQLRTLYAGPDGALYVRRGGLTRSPILRISPETLRVTASFGTSSVGLGNTASSFGSAVAFHVLPVFGRLGRTDYLIVGSSVITAIGNAPVGVLTAEDLTYVWGDGQLVLRGHAGIVTAEIGPGFSRAWLVVAPTVTTSASGSIFIYELRIEDGGRVSFALADSVSAAALDAGATLFGLVTGQVCRDDGDGGVIFVTSVNASGSPVYAVKWREGDGVVWSTPLSVSPLSGFTGFAASRVSGGIWAARFGAKVVRLDTATGEVIDETTWPGSTGAPQVYDARSESIVHHSGANALRRIYLDRGTGAGDTAGQIVSDLAARAGLAEADLDVSELTDVVSGYVIGRQTSARAAIEPLGAAYFFDGVESDDVIAFRKRGRAPVATLDAELLLRLDDNAVWRTTRAQEVELPARATVVAMNRRQGYRQLAQTAKRAEAPLAAMESREQATIELPIALSPREAKRIAESMLWSAWAGRDSYEARLPRDYLRLEPTDVVTLTLPSGAAFRARLTSAPVGADFTLSISAVSEEPATYLSAVEAGEGEGYFEIPIPGPAASRLFLPQIPLLRDEDSATPGASRVYFAAAGFTDPWPGASIFRGPDQVDWTRLGLVRSGPGWGALAAALPPPRAPWSFDLDNALDLFLVAGAEPESVTEAQLLAGANAALVFRASGEAEILQYRDAEEIGPGRWRLSTLLRGRRGTEVFAETDHAAGATVLMVQAAAVQGALVAAEEIDALRYWRAVGVGQDFDSAETLTAAHRGHDLRPYAPVHVSAALSGSDVVFSWVRRTRLSGGLRDGTGIVPLHEAAEAYELDILDAPGGAVLRTLSGSTPTATWTAAQIAADVGSTPGSVSVALYQISAEVGRGFARRVTVEIA